MALRRFIQLLRVHALARGRRAAAAAAARGQQARSRADARVRAIRAQGEVATSAAVACAEARARAAIAFFLRAQRQSGTAAAVAGHRLRRASDEVVSTFLWLAYGESAPKVCGLFSESCTLLVIYVNCVEYGSLLQFLDDLALNSQSSHLR
jgi:regulator of protease activity HflC (stomatin/prohibitin superfamily)